MSCAAAGGFAAGEAPFAAAGAAGAAAFGATAAVPAGVAGAAETPAPGESVRDTSAFNGSPGASLGGLSAAA
jgi:hypothetical protein